MTLPFSRSLLSLALAAALGAAGSMALLAHQPSVAQPVATNARGLPDFTDLVDLVGPSVVNIRTLERSTNRGPQGGAPDEEMLEFFRRFGIPIPPGVVPRGPRQQEPGAARRVRVVWARASCSAPMASS